MSLSRPQFLALTGVAGVGALTACGSTSPVADTGSSLGAEYDGPPVTISYWNGFTGGDGPAMRELVAKFNDSQDLVKVEQNTVNLAQYEQRATQAARQTLNPLDDVLDELRLDGSMFPDEVWRAGTYSDVRYGVPLDVHSLASYANRQLLQRADLDQQPRTGEELEQALRALGGVGVESPFWMPNRWPAHLMFLSLLWQFEGEPYAEDGRKATFAEEPGIEALTWMRKQVQEGFSPDNVALDTQYTAFKNGDGAFTWDGIWQINDLDGTAPDLEWSIAPLPRIGPHPAVWANSHQLVLFKQRQPDDDKLQASKAFIRYLTEQSAAWSGAGMIPARNDARESPEFRRSAQSALADAVPDMRFLPTVPGVPDVQVQTLELAVSDAVLGRQDPRAALDSAASKADQLLQANLRKFERSGA